MRETDLCACRRLAEERSERKLSQVKETFLRRTVQQMNMTSDVAEKMWEPAFAALKEKHLQWIDEDLEELEALILEAEVWRVAPPDDPEVLPLAPRNLDDDNPDSGFAGSGGSFVTVGLAVTSVARALQH
jgi:hypothetical protein